MRTKLIIFFIMTLLTVPAWAGGKSTIYGVVRDEHNAPVGEVEIVLTGEATYTSRVTESNSDGTFFLTQLPADEYIIEAAAPSEDNYKPASHNVFLKSGVEKEVNFTLKKR